MPSLPTITAYPLPTAHELPSNVADWTVDPGRAALLIHDMQKYFLRPFPSEIAQPLVRNIATLRQSCAAQAIPVTYTAQPGDMSPAERGLLRDFWGPGMHVGEHERAIIEPLSPEREDRVFTKWRYSAFFHSDLLDFLRERRRDQLILCGIYAHIGVLATAIESYSNDIETFLVGDAVADFTRDDHDMTLRYAANRCASVTVTASVADQLNSATLEDAR
ncbi:isochorismatase family protein [Nocardia noduli]|uniref:isochorismatase family protein n=1 Tax=Nocardia noduli TaxID=2815722 RepID=UPI001C217292|nr:isochorismatase family protein [Nocardia noduli]